MRVVTCSESEKETLVRMSGEQFENSLAHAPIALEDQFLAEVVVDPLGHELLVRSQRRVGQCRHLATLFPNR